ncbi:MAG: hypothetical protein WC263_04085 [Candidatus Micrarchaeia archaeon]|jgi:hypothetical protein
MLLWSNEREQFSRISLLFTISFSLLLIAGTLCMAFASFNLGLLLFALGVVLVAGNEYLVFRRLRTAEYAAALRTPSKSIEDLMNFAILAYILPSTSAIFLYFFAGMSIQVLVIVFAGFILTSIKIVSRSLQFYFSK